MAKQYDMKKSKGEIKEVQQKLETKKGELAKLEEQKQELLNSMMEVYGADLDEKTKEVVHQAINKALLENREKGEEARVEMNDDLNHLETTRQETQESKEDALNQKQNLEGKQKLLERFGIHSLEKGISELEQNIKELEQIDAEAAETMKALSEISHKLGAL